MRRLFFVLGFARPVDRSNCECFDSLVQATLVTCRFVLGHNAFVNHAVNYRYGILVGGRGSVFVAGITCLNNIFDLGAHKRTHAMLC